MTPAEAQETAEEEGLTLLRADNSTGFKDVFRSSRNNLSNPYQASSRHCGRSKSLERVQHFAGVFAVGGRQRRRLSIPIGERGIGIVKGVSHESALPLLAY